MVRNATADDAFRIAEIQVESWQAAYEGMIPDSYLRGLNAGKREPVWRGFAGDSSAPLFVISHGGEVAGFCHLSPSRDNDSRHAAEIIAIYVHPSRWRQGLGKVLCESALSVARERGFRIVTLWVLSGNEPAQRFYEAMGFQSDGASKVEAMPGFDLHEVRYSLRIDQGGHAG